MNVEQLIKRLQKCPPDSEVVRLMPGVGYHGCDFMEQFEIIENRGWRNKPTGTGEFLNAATIRKTRARKRNAVILY